ncbi:uncharacterized protein LOC111700509 [Eurytemora carolleeae]|uniref:uncharacterized protein LOC111700509 n=1 Tax=Eurytemora carolleeae TaxID=1294199 RepID=UPI000C77AB1A|nr:uncharacterized protein LOC111700509 [Eurytemora carolleeae]|eukprot:XP_023327207.1 uncharacterized protein LOC111700509 [Eurytemora affinis]
MKKEKKEEMERERIRQEKKMLKEKRREEAKLKEMEQKDSYAEYMVRGDQNGGSPSKHHHQNGHAQDTEEPECSGFSCIGLLVRLILYCMVGCVALGISLLWLYTDGKMDSDSIQAAVPVIQVDD